MSDTAAANDSPGDFILPPRLETLLLDLKRDIFANLNCIQVGQITKVTPGAQTVEVQLQIIRLAIDGSSTPYPVLLDCPYFVLGGGGAYIDMPIAEDDYCIVLFNDRDIDNWWTSGQVSAPNTPRKHSLSDGFALVGINPSNSVRAMDGTALRIINPNGIQLNGNSKSFVTWAELNSALQNLLTAINSKFGTKQDGSGSPGGLSLDISAAKTTTVKTGG